MLLLTALSDPIAFAVFLISLVSALTFHEFFHAVVADQLGDPTPRSAGRVSLNPLAHLDAMGSLSMLLLGFGWGKPVPINPRRFQHPVTDELLVALAGPAANLILALCAGAIVRLFPQAVLIAGLATIWAYMNISLMVFNLLPIPPLDGSKALRPLIGEEAFLQLERLALPLLIGVVIALQTTPLGTLLGDLASTLTAKIVGG